MRNFISYFSKIAGALMLMLLSATAFAQGTAVAPVVTEDPGSAFVIDVNTVLAIVAILLLLILAVLGYTLKSSMELYKQKNIQQKSSSEGSPVKAVTMIVGLLCASALTASAQAADAAAADGVFGQGSLLKYLLVFIIFIELVAIFAVIKWLRFFTGIEELQVTKGKKGILSLSFNNWWRKFNRFKSIKDESEIDMGHSYDGIRELDNVLPPWFTWSFAGTIVFAIVYLWRFYGASNPAPNQYQEFEASMVKAKIAQDAYIAAKGGEIDENNVVMLGASEIATGAKLYQANCVACHGDKGQGGVGPNLTDDYWIHGGKIGDVFRTIKVGVVDKGMQSWKDVFSATQIAELSSYIKSIHGTNPAGAKAPQGDVFKDAADAAAPATAADSTATAAPADSAAAK